MKRFQTWRAAACVAWILLQGFLAAGEEAGPDKPPDEAKKPPDRKPGTGGPAMDPGPAKDEPFAVDFALDNLDSTDSVRRWKAWVTVMESGEAGLKALKEKRKDLKDLTGDRADWLIEAMGGDVKKHPFGQYLMGHGCQIKNDWQGAGVCFDASARLWEERSKAEKKLVEAAKRVVMEDEAAREKIIRKHEFNADDYSIQAASARLLAQTVRAFARESEDAKKREKDPKSGERGPMFVPVPNPPKTEKQEKQP